MPKILEFCTEVPFYPDKIWQGRHSVVVCGDLPGKKKAKYFDPQ